MKSKALRIYDLARRLAIPSREILDMLKTHGIEIASHMNTIEEPVVDLILKTYGPKKIETPAKTEQPKPERKPVMHTSVPPSQQPLRQPFVSHANVISTTTKHRVSDLEIIKQLEQQIGQPLPQLERFTSKCDIGYVLNEHEDVIGLCLSWIEISNLTLLQSLTALQKLDLSENQITDVTVLQGLTALQILDLSENQIPDVTALQGLTALQILDLRENQIPDVTALQGLTALQWLYLQGNQIPDVTALQGLTVLQGLDLSRNQITDVTALQGLTNLQILGLSQNQITDVTALQGLTALQWLNLSENQIADVTALQDLMVLLKLKLSRNQITDVTALQGLMALEDLDLTSNKIFFLPRELLNLQLEIYWKEGVNSGINLYNNPLIDPPIEIVKQGRATILAYWESLACLCDEFPYLHDFNFSTKYGKFLLTAECLYKECKNSRLLGGGLNPLMDDKLMSKLPNDGLYHERLIIRQRI